jgi:hypothetical protein
MEPGLGTNVKAIIDVRGDIRLDDRWFAPYHLDIGTGGSDQTWNASFTFFTACIRVSLVPTRTRPAPVAGCRLTGFGVDWRPVLIGSRPGWFALLTSRSRAGDLRLVMD